MQIFYSIPAFGLLIFPYVAWNYAVAVSDNSNLLRFRGKLRLGAVSSSSGFLLILLSGVFFAEIVFRLVLTFELGVKGISALYLLGMISIIGLFFLVFLKMIAAGRLMHFLYIFGALFAAFSILGEARVYNFDDDLAKYFLLPSGLHQVGAADFGEMSITSSVPLSAAHLFQAFSVKSGGYAALGYWDMALGALLLGAFLSFRPVSSPSSDNSNWGLTTASLFAMFFICHVMYVNITPIYFPVMIASIAFFFASESPKISLTSILVIASVAMWLIFVKENYLVIAGALVLFLFGRVCVNIFKPSSDPSRKMTPAGLEVLAVLTLSSLFFLVAWSQILGVVNYISSVFSGSAEGLLDKILPLANVDANFYGFGSISYFSVIFSVLLAFLFPALFLLSKVLGRRSASELCVTLNSSAAALLVLSLSVLLGFFVLFATGRGAVDANLRYMMPSVMCLFLFILMSSLLGGASKHPSMRYGLLASCVFFCGVNFPSFLLRANQASNVSNFLSFPAAKLPAVIKYSEFALSEEAAKFYTELQKVAPPRSRVLAQVGLPWRFDLARNDFVFLDPSGQVHGLIGGGLGYLEERGVSTVIRQVGGVGVRSESEWRVWGSSGGDRERFADTAVTLLRALERIERQCGGVTVADRFVVTKVDSCEAN